MGLMRTLKRDLGAQLAVARNLEEGLIQRCCRYWWATIYLGKAFWIGLSSLRDERLGSRVIYEGRDCFILNWAGSSHPTLAGDGFYEQNVPREKITNVVNISELWHRFESGFSFYMGYWYGIDVNRRVYPEIYRTTTRNV